MPTTTLGKVIHILFVAVTDPNAQAILSKLVSDLAAVLGQASAADKPAT